MINRGIPALFLLFITFSCGESDPDISGLKRAVEIKRLDKEIYSSSTIEELEKNIASNRQELDLFFGLSNLPHDSILVRMLWNRIQNTSIDSFYNDYLQKFEDLTWLEEEVSDLFGHIRYYYPDFQDPKVSAIFSAYLDRDIVMSKNEIVVSLEFFYGPDAKYRPRLPEYMARRYRVPYLVPMFIGLGLSQGYNEVSSSDQSLLAEMIYYGKSHFFVSKMDPDLPDTLNFGFSGEEVNLVQEEFEDIWSYFVERDLLFTNNFSEINRYVGERPNVLEISPDCPGRIGRYIGYQIVRSYFENNSVELPALMAEPDAQKIFRESGFNPSKVSS